MSTQNMFSLRNKKKISPLKLEKKSFTKKSALLNPCHAE